MFCPRTQQQTRRKEDLICQPFSDWTTHSTCWPTSSFNNEWQHSWPSKDNHRFISFLQVSILYSSATWNFLKMSPLNSTCHDGLLSQIIHALLLALPFFIGSRRWPGPKQKWNSPKPLNSLYYIRLIQYHIKKIPQNDILNVLVRHRS